MLLIRSCALVLPPNQYGLDFIVPVLLAPQDGHTHPVYSYIGFQSKSSMAFNQFEVVAKTRVEFSLKKCTQTGNCSRDRCNEGTACYTDEEFELVTKEQLTVVMSLGHGESEPTYDRTTFYVDNYYSNRRPAEADSRVSERHQRVQNLKRRTFLRAMMIWPSNIMRDINFECAKVYPSFGSLRKTKPNLILKRTFPSFFRRGNSGNPATIQRMIWASGESRKTLTCLISHDIINHQHLLESGRACQDIKNMINDQNTIFTDIPNFHLDFVVDSCINGSFSSFDQFNPHLRAARGNVRLPYPLRNLGNFTSEALHESIRRCIARNNGDGEPL